jgi:hypothetical protein
VLLEAYAEEAMTLHQLMAFTVNPDPALEEQVWRTSASTGKGCDRRLLRNDYWSAAMSRGAAMDTSVLAAS